MLYNTQAIVLNKHNYGDTSLICNLFTLEQGKICIIAKGARSIKNPNSAILQPLNFIQLIYYYKNRRNIQTLKEASILNKHFRIDENYDKMFYALIVIDIINKISFHNNPCNIIFRLTQKTLDKIDKSSPDNIKIYLGFFQLQLLVYLGYSPILSYCYKCKSELAKGFFNQTDGHLCCKTCCNKNDTFSIDKNGLQILKYIKDTHINKLSDGFIFNKKILSDVGRLLNKLMLFYLPELKKSTLLAANLANE